MDDLEEGDLKRRSKGGLLDVWAKKKGVHLVSFCEGTIIWKSWLTIIESLGLATPQQPIPPTPETVTAINYTSGTMGMPIGVILTHANAIAAPVGPKMMETLK